jgi:acetyltransferase
MGGKAISKAAGLFRQARIPEYRFAEQAVSALGALSKRAEFLKKADQSPPKWEDIDAGAAKTALKNSQAGTFLDSEAAGRLLSAYRIPFAPVILAQTEEQAGKAAKQLGFPVVLKVASQDISHKSETGGVLLNIRNKDEAQAGFRNVTENAQRGMPEARLEGVLVQHMVSGGQEVIIGVKRDAQFGPLVMFGSGGVEVEGLKDVAFALAPLPTSEAEDLLQRTWAGRKLAGFRNIPAGDAMAVKEVLQRLAQLSCDHPEIAEIEINPLRVLAPGEGVVAVDVRVRLE